MRKILVSLLAVGSTSVFAAAADYSQFQAFDNQVSVGYGMQSSTSTAVGGGNNVTSNNNNVYLNGERLLNNGVWVNVVANMAFGSGETQNSAIQNNYGVNGKVGYAFPIANQHLLLTPYALAGLNNNGLVQYNLASPSGQPVTSSANTSNQYFYTGGLGGRIEYRINNAILVYGDQSVAYNWDQSGPQNGIEPQNNILFTSTAGAKFNIVKDFQLGVAGFYQNYQPQASGSGLNGIQVSQPQDGLGGLVTVGLTY